MSKKQKELEKAVDSLWLKKIIDIVEYCRIKRNIKRHFARNNTNILIKNINMKNNEIKLSKEQADEFINVVEEVGHYEEQQIDSFYDKLVSGLSKFIPKRFLKK